MGGLSRSPVASLSDRVIPNHPCPNISKAFREAGLIRSERYGVEMRNTSRCGEVEERFPGLTPAILNGRYSPNLTSRRYYNNAETVWRELN